MRIIGLFQERSSKLSNGSERKTLSYSLTKSTKSGAGSTGILPVPCWRCWIRNRITVFWIISWVDFLSSRTPLLICFLLTAWICQWIFLVFFSSVQVRLVPPSSALFTLGDHDQLANTLDTIPAPLLDRMEVLEVSGYVSEEKAVIAERFLAPQAKEASGLQDADVVLERETVDVLIKYYCRESGMRNLKKHIDKVCPSYLSIRVWFLTCMFRGVDLPQGCAQSRARPWRGDVPGAQGVG